MASTLTQDENVGTLEISVKNGEFESRQKVNEKREMDVQLIKLRQYLIIPFVEPLPTGAFARLEGNQIWEMVLEYMTSPFDIDSAQRTCPAFEDILLEKIPTAPPGEREVSAVLKIMRKGEHSRAWDHSPWQLRLVSKSWQRAVDQALRSEYEGEWHLELDEGRWWKDDFDVTRITNADLAWNIVESSNSRTSLLQIIRLDEGHMNEVGIFYPRILEFLDEYGEHVKGLIVEWRDNTISFASKYLNLLSFIMRMPNLKALAINVKTWSPDIQEEVADDLKDLMLRHPFPSFLSMDVLSIQGHYYDPLLPLIPIVTEILSNCGKLKSISIPEYILYEESIVRAMEGRNIEFIDCHVDNPPMILRMLTSLPLKKIVLRKLGYRNCSDFIRALNLFGGTLEYLELPRSMKFQFRSGRVALQLPKLRTLILGSWTGLENLDVFAPLSSLEYLEITYKAYFRNYKLVENKNKVYLAERRNGKKLEKSKIWARFPNLRSIKVSVKMVDNTYGSYDSENGFQVVCHYVKRGKEIRMEVSRGYHYENWSSDSDIEF